MTAKTRFTGTYRFVRSLNLVWWLIAAYFFYNAAMSLSQHGGHQPNGLAFTFWIAACIGVVMAIRRGNKNREQHLAKLAKQHRAG